MLVTGCSKIPSGNAVNNSGVVVDLYVMSQCPYGVQAEQAFESLIEDIGDEFTLNINYIGRGDADNLESLHGENEVNGNIIQLCAKKYESDDHFKLLSCMNKEPTSIPDNWEKCAEKLDMDVDQLKECYDGKEGKQMLADSFALAEKAGAQGSPTFFINNEPYEGKRDTKSLYRVICGKLGDDAPSECDNIPKPLEFDITVINDKKCGAACDTSVLETNLKRIFEGAKINTVDVSDVKDLLKEFNIEKLPAFVFDKKVKQSDEWKSQPNLAGAFEDLDAGLKIKDEVSGATYFIDPVKRDAFEKAQKAAKEQSLKTLGVNYDNKPQIDFFVMSYCPYGNQAEEAIKPVYDELKGKVDFNPRYVIYKDYQGSSPEYCVEGYCSMHGIQELHQDMRELCVHKNDGDEAWFKFAITMNRDCTYQNADTCWEGVAKKLGMNVDKVKQCEKNDGLNLVKSESSLNSLLNVQGSPQIFVEGTEYQGSRSSAGYQKALCDQIKGDKPAGCVVPLAGESNQQAAASGAGCGV